MRINLVIIFALFTSTLNAQVAPASATPAPVAATSKANFCLKDYECMAVVSSCCGEEYQPINRATVLGFKAAIHASCREQQKNNPTPCKHKKKRLFPPKSRCIEKKCTLGK